MRAARGFGEVARRRASCRTIPRHGDALTSRTRGSRSAMRRTMSGVPSVDPSIHHHDLDRDNVLAQARRQCTRRCSPPRLVTRRDQHGDERAPGTGPCGARSRNRLITPFTAAEYGEHNAIQAGSKSRRALRLAVVAGGRSARRARAARMRFPQLIDAAHALAPLHQRGEAFGVAVDGRPRSGGRPWRRGPRRSARHAHHDSARAIPMQESAVRRPPASPPCAPPRRGSRARAG